VLRPEGFSCRTSVRNVHIGSKTINAFQGNIGSKISAKKKKSFGLMEKYGRTKQSQTLTLKPSSGSNPNWGAHEQFRLLPLDGAEVKFGITQFTLAQSVCVPPRCCSLRMHGRLLLSLFHGTGKKTSWIARLARFCIGTP